MLDVADYINEVKRDNEMLQIIADVQVNDENCTVIRVLLGIKWKKSLVETLEIRIEFSKWTIFFL